MANLEYPKIYTLYDRNEKYKVDVSKIRRPEFKIINNWQVTEKVNGRNTRITLFSNGDVVYGGKTDNSDIPSELLKYLMKVFTSDKMKEVFWIDKEKIPSHATVYGEGYGSKMASGSGIYRKNNDVSFRMFDCLVDTWWLERGNIEDIASKFGVDCVPIIDEINYLPQDIQEIKDMFYKSLSNLVAFNEGNYTNENLKTNLPEGIVARSVPLLFNRNGERVMWKLKIKDFK